MHKLLILPGACHSLGGTLVTLSLLIKGFVRLGAADRLVVLVWSDSVMENYLQEAGYGDVLQSIPAKSSAHFLQQALQWVNQQPRSWPLLLDNCVERKLLPVLLKEAPRLRYSRRIIYHFFHDLALSQNILGLILRKITFWALHPIALCNSWFTAHHILRFVEQVHDILYQPVDFDRFHDRPSLAPSPEPLLPILKTGSKVILTPSRITQPNKVNNKNLRALIPVLSCLKTMGHDYHLVLVGEDRSSGKANSRDLLELAEQWKVADRFTILPPAFDIENYYRHADVVVTLAPREPFGRTVVEAIACGVPVIGSYTGGLGETLHYFAREWLVDPDDPYSVAETIVRVVEERPEETAECLRQGKQWIEANCRLELYTERIMRLTGTLPTRKPVLQPVA